MRAHNQHSETRRPSDRDRIVTTGPSRSSPPVQKCCAEMMSVSVAGIPKNRCRTTIPERRVETRAELPFIGDQVGLFRAQTGRPTRAPPAGCGGDRAGFPAVGGIGNNLSWLGEDPKWPCDRGDLSFPVRFEHIPRQWGGGGAAPFYHPPRQGI